MSPSLFDTFAASALEAALRAALAADAATRAELGALAPRRLRLALERPPLSLTLVFEEHGVRVETDPEADAVVHATPAAVVDLFAGDVERAVMSGGVRIEGDGDLAMTAFRVLSALSPDLEGPLARLVGEAPAAAAGAAARRSGAAARRAFADGAVRSRSWLTAPGGPLPGRPEVARFLDEVDEARLAADRLEARVRRLAAARDPAPDAADGQDPPA
jgi:ubiquinone biosynthesis protein UbiJ